MLSHNKENAVTNRLNLHEELKEIGEAEEIQLSNSKVEIFDIKRKIYASPGYSYFRAGVSFTESLNSNMKLIWGTGIQHDYDNTNYREMKEYLREAEFTELDLSNIFLFDTQNGLLTFKKHFDIFVRNRIFFFANLANRKRKSLLGSAW